MQFIEVSSWKRIIRVNGTYSPQFRLGYQWYYYWNDECISISFTSLEEAKNYCFR